MDQFLTNLTNFTIKFLPILVTAAVLSLTLLTSRMARKVVSDAITHRPTMAALFLGVVVTICEAMLTSSIINAAEHHYFFFSYFLAFSVLALLVWMTRKIVLSSGSFMVMFIGWVCIILASGSVLFGFKGVLSVRPYHESLMADKSCLEGLNEPFFIANPILSLPWIMPAKQNFVLQLNYPSDRAAGIEKEHDGIGGMIDHGYFASLALYKGHKGHFDGSDLKLYRQRPGSCREIVIYDRNEKIKLNSEVP